MVKNTIMIKLSKKENAILVDLYQALKISKIKCERLIFLEGFKLMQKQVLGSNLIGEVRQSIDKKPIMKKEVVIESPYIIREPVKAQFDFNEIKDEPKLDNATKEDDEDQLGYDLI